MRSLMHLGGNDEAVQLGQELVQNYMMDDVRRVEILYSLGLAYPAAGRAQEALQILEELAKVSLDDPANGMLLQNRLDMLRAYLKAQGLPVPPRSAEAEPSTVCCG